MKPSASLIAACLALASAGGCSSSTKVETSRELAASVNKRVTVQGTAARFARRPIVRTPTFWAYVMNPRAWPEEAMGRSVRVTGTLRQEPYPGDPATAGAASRLPNVLERASYKVVE